MDETPPSNKELALNAISTLPDDATMDDVIETLLFVLRIQRGLADADAGRTIPHEEVVRRIREMRSRS